MEYYRQAHLPWHLKPGGTLLIWCSQNGRISAGIVWRYAEELSVILVHPRILCVGRKAPGPPRIIAFAGAGRHPVLIAGSLNDFDRMNTTAPITRAGRGDHAGGGRRRAHGYHIYQKEHLMGKLAVIPLSSVKTSSIISLMSPETPLI